MSAAPRAVTILEPRLCSPATLASLPHVLMFRVFDGRNSGTRHLGDRKTRALMATAQRRAASSNTDQDVKTQHLKVSRTTNTNSMVAYERPRSLWRQDPCLFFSHCHSKPGSRLSLFRALSFLHHHWPAFRPRRHCLASRGFSLVSAKCRLPPSQQEGWPKPRQGERGSQRGRRSRGPGTET